MLRLIAIAVVLLCVASKYEENLGREYWYISTASYCRHSKIYDWTCGKPCSLTQKPLDVKVFINKTGNDAGFGAYHPQHNTILLVFRGTVPWLIKNLIQDIDFIKRDYPFCGNGCQVHRGFHNAFLEIQNQVLEHYLYLKGKYPQATLTVTGHSLGGAMAHHALVFLESNGHQVDTFLTYGSPRVGDDKFVKFVKELYPHDKHRIVHSRDPFPHLPLVAMGFSHANTEIFYKNRKEYKICDDAEKEDRTCANSQLFNLDFIDHIYLYELDQLIHVPLCQ